MKKLLLVFLALGPYLHAQTQGSTAQSVPPPQALCTSGVDASECNQLTEWLAFLQQASPFTRIVQFVIADDASYKAEKRRIGHLIDNRIDDAPKNSKEATRLMLAPNFLLSGPSDSFYELSESSRTISKVYFNETTSCHQDPKTFKTNVFDINMCSSELHYVLGFVEGAFLDSNNFRNYQGSR